MTLHWALVLKSFDDDAPKTLLAQNDLLQLVADVADPSLSLTIRLVAGADRGRVSAACFLLCEGSQRSKQTAETLLDVASVGLLPGYNITHGGHPRAHYEHSMSELTPVLAADAVLPIKPDWAQLIDLLRRRARPMVIDIRCSFTRSAPRSPSPTPPVLGSDAGTPLLEALVRTSHDARALSLSVVVSEPRRVDTTFASALGRKLFGTTCEITPLESVDGARGTPVVPNEALRVWHWPYGEIQGRGLGRATANLPLVATDPPKKGMSLGYARQEGPRLDQLTDVFLSPTDRMRHVYIVGKTGSGKTNLMKRIARQDISAGKGGVVISPHGDIIDYLIDTAGSRSEDIVFLDFGDPRFVPQLNPLSTDVSSSADFARAAEQLTDLVAGLNYHEFSGPVFHDAVRTALHTAALPELRGDRDPNIAVAIEIVRDARLRDWSAKVAEKSRRDIALELSRVGDLRASERSEYERWVTAKFDAFAVDGPLRAVTSTAGQSPFSLRDIYRGQKILLVHLPDTYLGGDSAEFIGRFIFERLYQEARLTPAAARREFYVHVDEFQRYVNRDLEVLVTEARKFQLGLTFAHQNLRQLHAFSRFEGTSSPRLAEAIFSNVGTLVAMRTSGSDVGTIAQELEVREQHVRRIAQYEALARPSLGGVEQRTFTLRVPLESSPNDKSARSSLRKRMISEGYWARRTAVERELETHLRALRDAADPAKRNRRTPRSPANTSTKSSFLDEWLAKRDAAKSNADDGDTPSESEGKTA